MDESCVCRALADGDVPGALRSSFVKQEKGA